MKIIRTVSEWQELRRSLVGSLGFVPTMGALHAGHRSLVEKSERENDLTAVSIFVNPTQFNDPADFEKYPKTWEEDVALLEAAGVDFLFAPDFSEMYPDGYRYSMNECEESRVLCGEHRPGHFEGVLSVVLKLLNLVQADRAYFGEKDYQQLKLIEGMARAFFMKTQVIPCPTVREVDGLALSSRNRRLTTEERRKAPLFFKTLSQGRSPVEMRVGLENAGFQVEYIEERWGRRFGAVTLGSVRLIDNVAL